MLPSIQWQKTPFQKADQEGQESHPTGDEKSVGGK